MNSDSADAHILLRPTVLRFYIGDVGHNGHAMDDAANDGAGAVKVRSGGRGDEELAANALAAWSAVVGKGDNTRLGKRKGWYNLVWQAARKSGARGLARSRWVAPLRNEAWRHAVKERAVVGARGAQREEVGAGARHGRAVQLDLDVAFGCVQTYTHRDPGRSRAQAARETLPLSCVSRGSNNCFVCRERERGERELVQNRA